jgi:uncharacterized RDD family membrane protein YckC
MEGARMFCSTCGAEINAGSAFCQRCGQPATAASPAAYAAQPGTSGHAYGGGPQHLGPRYAGFWLRVVAAMVDGFILGIPMGAAAVAAFFLMGGPSIIARIAQTNDPNQIQNIVPSMIGSLFGFYGIIFAVGIVSQWLYYALMESSARQATLGKMVLHLYVTDMNGNRISFGRASGRVFTKVGMGFVPLGFVGYILAGFTERKQALEDFVASTLVYRRD